MLLLESVVSAWSILRADWRTLGLVEIEIEIKIDIGASGANAYNLLVLNHVGPTVMEFASTMIEFMSKKGVKDGFEKKEINPFVRQPSTLCLFLTFRTHFSAK